MPVFGTTHYTYDITAGLPAGHWAEQTQTPDGKTTRRVYDKAGRLSEVIDNGTVTATYTYYANGNQQRVTYPNSTNSLNNIFTEFTYYADNSLHTLKSGRGTQTLEAYNYLYDANGNLISPDE